jgi:hypothetical protein
MFAVERRHGREPLTKEPVGAPLEATQLAIAAKWCCAAYNRASYKSGGRAGQGAHRLGRSALSSVSPRATLSELSGHGYGQFATDVS